MKILGPTLYLQLKSFGKKRRNFALVGCGRLMFFNSFHLILKQICYWRSRLLCRRGSFCFLANETQLSYVGTAYRGCAVYPGETFYVCQFTLRLFTAYTLGHVAVAQTGPIIWLGLTSSLSSSHTHYTSYLSKKGTFRFWRVILVVKLQAQLLPILCLRVPAVTWCRS